jgi:hypothetical protein
MPINPGCLTRRELARYLTANGYPTSFATLNRLCAPSCGAGPPTAGVWAGQAYYEPVRAIAWARSRFRSTEMTRGRRRAST